MSSPLKDLKTSNEALQSGALGVFRNLSNFKGGAFSENS